MKFEPVRWMTWTLAILMMITGSTAVWDLIPPRVGAIITMAIALLTAVLGVLARQAVLPMVKLVKGTDGVYRAPSVR